MNAIFKASNIFYLGLFNTYENIKSFFFVRVKLKSGAAILKYSKTNLR